MRLVVTTIACACALLLGSCGHEEPCHGCEDHGVSPDLSYDAGDVGEVGPANATEEQAVDFCDCMFSECHDYYHDKWGQDESISRAGCLAEARRQVSLGRPSQNEPSIECRQHYCDALGGNESLCASVITACEP